MLIEPIITGALCVLGVYASMGEGMILHGLEQFLVRISDNNVLRPLRPALYECPICMASFWGTIFWLMMGAPLFWPLYVFGMAGLNYIIVNAVDE